MVRRGGSLVRTYQLYLIDDEFASHYFGREKMFFDLFAEYNESFGELKNILKKQIQFITKPLSTLRLQQYILQQLGKNQDFEHKQGIYYIQNGNVSSAKLEIFEKHITLHAFGSYEAETLFFEVLRKSESSFLAIDLVHERYGWLRPIKERKLI